MNDNDRLLREIVRKLTNLSNKTPPTPFRKGEITAVTAGTPPTVTVNLSGTEVAGIRYVTDYTPVVGDVAVLIKDRGSYLVVASVRAANAAVSVDAEESAVGTTTSTSYTATITGGTACSTTFTVPTSGKVMIYNVARTFNSTPPNLAIMGFELRAGAVVGSGTVLLSPTENDSVFSIYDTRGSSATLVEGLGPGEVMNVRQFFKVTGGTGSFGNRKLIVTAG